MKTSNSTVLRTAAIFVGATIILLGYALRIFHLQESKAQELPNEIPLLQAMGEQQDGPIEIHFLKESTSPLEQDKAIQIANQCAGLKTDSNRIWAAVVTDHEYMGGLLKDRSCWLIEYKDALTLPTDEEKERRVTLYVVVDAETETCWEAFTAPKEAWWKRVSFKDAEVVQRFKDWYEQAIPANDLPSLPLARALQLLVQQKFLTSDIAKSEQIIARHFNYTTGGEGAGIKRVDGLSIVPGIKDQPIWYISLEGINSPFRGSVPPPNPGEAPIKVPDTEEINVAINGVTGELISVGSYR